MAFPRRREGDKLGMSVHAAVCDCERASVAAVASVLANVVWGGCACIYLAAFLSCVFFLYLQTISRTQLTSKSRTCNVNIEKDH